MGTHAGGTPINPFYTALPLAQAVKTPPSISNLPICPPPRTTPPLTGYTPEMCFQDAGNPTTGKKYYLCEYPVDNVGPPSDPNNNCENAGITQDGTSSLIVTPFLRILTKLPRSASSFVFASTIFKQIPVRPLPFSIHRRGMPGVSMTLGANPQIADCRRHLHPCKQIFPPDPPTPRSKPCPLSKLTEAHLRPEVLYEAF